ncbi:hypothetical protein NDN08_002777 [Rhodosorus marinus]|uniref:Uncharacterized protein n=1 Tax=Rhodosorus marinus TaxID=101924 RepID=A0AAV8UUS9_9RHOD|nr:hypothetical protein NDN08_002777 [Rhodosorus marinus]
MVRVAIFCVFSLALLGMARSTTCSDEPDFSQFIAYNSSYDLVDRVGGRFGVLNVAVEERPDANFFKMDFTALPGLLLRKVRVGLFASGGIDVEGNNRYTRRRNFSRLSSDPTTNEGSLRIKASEIPVLAPDITCCGAQLDFYAFALVQHPGDFPDVRVFIKPSGTDVSCRVPNPKKPFLQICPIEAFCTTCLPTKCEIPGTSSQCTEPELFTEKCQLNQKGILDPLTGLCGCQLLKCPLDQCIDSHACLSVSAFQPQCPVNMVATQGRGGLCECMLGGPVRPE